MNETTELAIRWENHHRILRSGSDLSFGRAADLTLDDNPYLHRQVGRFVETAQTNGTVQTNETGWSVINDGRATTLRVATGAGLPTVELAPGESATLSEAGRVIFEAGSTTYEIDFAIQSQDVVIDITVPELGRRDLRVLLALCEPRLLNPDSERVLVPGVSQVASRLALSLDQVNSAINSLSDAYRRSVGMADSNIADGLDHLVRWAVDRRVVDSAQLDSLNQPVTQLIQRQDDSR